jgi:hypothetical protein
MMEYARSPLLVLRPSGERGQRTKELALGMRKKPAKISALAVLGLLVFGQSASESAAAPIGGSTPASQAILTGKSGFTSHSGSGGKGVRSGKRRMDREFDDGQGSSGRRGLYGPRFAERGSFEGGKRGENWRYDAGYYDGGYGEYRSRYSYSYGPDPYSYGPGPNYGPSPGYGPHY